MNIVFMGTPEFAVPCLERLIKDGHTILAAFTQPDKPKGRGHSFAAPPVKLKAVENNICVYQPTTLKDGEAYNILSKLSPDIIIVAAYGKILPQQIISLPKYGCVCIHASLLPKYRGAAPIQWAIINGEKVTGVTSIQMDAGIDTGDMLLSEQTEIGKNENSGELLARLSMIGAEVMAKTIIGLQVGTITPVKQDESASNYAPMLTKTLCPVNWNEPAIKIHNRIRGLSPFLISTAILGEKLIRIHAAQPVEGRNGKPGEVIENKDMLVVACGDGNAVEIITVQVEGKRAMSAKEFMRGNSIDIGSVFE